MHRLRMYVNIIDMIEYLIYCKSWKVEEVYTQDYGTVSRMAGAVRRGEAVAKYEGFGAEWWEYWVPSMELAESVVYANRELFLDLLVL